MKTIKDVLYFCQEFTFYIHYNIERVKEFNYVFDLLIIVLPETGFNHEDNRIEVMSITDDILLKVIDGGVKNIAQEN